MDYWGRGREGKVTGGGGWLLGRKERKGYLGKEWNGRVGLLGEGEASWRTTAGGRAEEEGLLIGRGGGGCWRRGRLPEEGLRMEGKDFFGRDAGVGWHSLVEEGLLQGWMNCWLSGALLEEEEEERAFWERE